NNRLFGRSMKRLTVGLVGLAVCAALTSAGAQAPELTFTASGCPASQSAAGPLSSVSDTVSSRVDMTRPAAADTAHPDILLRVGSARLAVRPRGSSASGRERLRRRKWNPDHYGSRGRFSGLRSATGCYLNGYHHCLRFD